VLLVEVQVDAERLQLGEQLHQVLQAAAEPVDTPGGDQVELATAVASVAPRPGRLSRSLAPLTQVSSNTRTTSHPDRGATASSSRCWFSVV
jgi:hypothetical protein